MDENSVIGPLMRTALDLVKVGALGRKLMVIAWLIALALFVIDLTWPYVKPYAKKYLEAPV